MEDVRIGFGYDSHRFGAGRPLVLGGVEFPGEPGLAGHSDADAVIHAVVDAVLGAAGMGDIGARFPDSDETWRGADSAKMLEAVVAEARAAGWTVGNVDVAVVCERPRIGPHAQAMRRRLAELLWPGSPDASRVSVKGKTNERMDDVGAGLGVEVHAACLLRKGKEK